VTISCRELTKYFLQNPHSTTEPAGWDCFDERAIQDIAFLLNKTQNWGLRLEAIQRADEHCSGCNTKANQPWTSHYTTPGGRITLNQLTVTQPCKDSLCLWSIIIVCTKALSQPSSIKFTPYSRSILILLSQLCLCCSRGGIYIHNYMKKGQNAV
jgi:hypothetical protein